MPFVEADSRAVSFGNPVLRMNKESFESGLVQGWDYLTPLAVVAVVEYDEALLTQSTGITDVTAIAAYVQVECLATHLREVVTVRLEPGARSVRMDVEIPAGTVAQELLVSQGLVLATQDAHRASPLAAELVGSRLAKCPDTAKFVLEGDGASFPVEAFDFAIAGLAPAAPWHLHFGASSLGDPFKRHVRLQINSAHPQGAALASGSDPLVSSVLLHAVVQELLAGAVQLLDEEWETEFAEESVGQVVDSLAHQYLAMSIGEVKTFMENDPFEFQTRLRAAMELLGEGARE